VLRIEFAQFGAVAQSKTVLPRLAKLFSSEDKLVVPARWTGDAVIVGFPTALAAAKSALSVASALRKRMAIRCSAHYGMARVGTDPFAGTPFLFGPAAEWPSKIAYSTPPGAIHVSEDFAAALCAGRASGRPRVEFIGELPNERSGETVKLYSLKR
jgi:class 3 adenylate cyclase